MTTPATPPTSPPDPRTARHAFAALVEGFSRGDYAAAEANARVLLRLIPGDANLRRMLGTALAAQGRADEAIVSFRQALVIQPEYPDAGFELAGTLLAAGDGDGDGAIRGYRRVLLVAPNHVEAHFNLANAERDRGRPERALIGYARAFSLAPDTDTILIHAVEAIKRVVEAPNREVLEVTRPLLVACFRSREIETNTVNLFSQTLMRGDFAALLSCPADVDLAALDRLSGGLLTAQLVDSLVTDGALEVFLTALRRRLLIEAEIALSDLETLARAFAYQGVLNEFVWDVDPEEAKAVDGLAGRLVADIELGREINRRDLYLLSAYRSVAPMTAIRLWAAEYRKSAESMFAADLDFLVLDRERERTLAGDIQDLTVIDDTVSLLVKAQYEDNPYPRWNGLRRDEPIAYVDHIRHEIRPNQISLVAMTAAPRVLIAGCGTGRQPILAAMTYAGASILGVDLSLASLAYAKRRATEFGVDAIRFARADILRLGDISERFDVIECSGVLHHMANPEDGLRALSRVLAPGGFLKLALYSRAARGNVTRLRRWIAEQGFPATLDGIRAFRRQMHADGHPDAAATRQSVDFYATSAIRDLLFHAQEHQYTVPSLKRLLDENGFEFLGFLFPDPAVKAAYIQKFPDDPACIDLANWHRFEVENPLTFVAMYQVWCRPRETGHEIAAAARS